MFEKIISLLESIAISLMRIADSHAPMAEGKALAPVRTEAAQTSGFMNTAISNQIAVTAEKSQATFCGGDTGPTVTREQCGNALIALATSKGRDAAVTVLTTFGAKLLKDVKDADISKFFAAITEASK